MGIQLVPGKEHTIFNIILLVKWTYVDVGPVGGVLRLLVLVHSTVCILYHWTYVWMPANIIDVYSMHRQVVVDAQVVGRVF